MMAKTPEDMIQAEVARLVAKALTDIAAKLAAPEPEPPKQAHLVGAMAELEAALARG